MEGRVGEWWYRGRDCRRVGEVIWSLRIVGVCARVRNAHAYLYLFPCMNEQRKCAKARTYLHANGMNNQRIKSRLHVEGKPLFCFSLGKKGTMRLARACRNNTKDLKKQKLDPIFFLNISKKIWNSNLYQIRYLFFTFYTSILN